MAEGTIVIGDTTLDTPVGYIAKENHLKVYERTPYGTLIINRNVNVENQPISVYHFEISDLINSKMYAIKEEAAHVSNLYYIDYLQIVEVLSGDGSTTTFYTQRQIYTKTDPVPVVTVDGESAEPTITLNVSGRGRLVFATAPSHNDDNIVIRYEPKFIVHIVDYQYIGRIMDVGHYSLICEEVKP
jgi:hypothetical protein